MAILLMAILAAVWTVAAMPVHPHSHGSANCQICHLWNAVQSVIDDEIGLISPVLQVFPLPLGAQAPDQDSACGAAHSRGPPRIASTQV
jgi:hypothetical protein